MYLSLKQGHVKSFGFFFWALHGYSHHFKNHHDFKVRPEVEFLVCFVAT